MEIISINLSQFVLPGSTVLYGRLTGEHARTILHLDEVDLMLKKNSRVEVEFHFPEGLTSVNDSFMSGLLSKTFKAVGSDTFVARVKFVSRDEHVLESLRGLTHLLRNINSAWKI